MFLKVKSHLSGTNANLPFNQWHVYAAGAHVILFDGTLRIDVARIGSSGVKSWCVVAKHHSYGCVYIASKCKTKKVAMEKSEEWIMKKVDELNYLWLMSDSVVKKGY